MNVCAHARVCLCVCVFPKGILFYHSSSMYYIIMHILHHHVCKKEDSHSIQSQSIKNFKK